MNSIACSALYLKKWVLSILPYLWLRLIENEAKSCDKVQQLILFSWPNLEDTHFFKLWILTFVIHLNRLFYHLLSEINHHNLESRSFQIFILFFLFWDLFFPSYLLVSKVTLLVLIFLKNIQLVHLNNEEVK